jgi:hypothetical protein
LPPQGISIVPGDLYRKTHGEIELDSESAVIGLYSELQGASETVVSDLLDMRCQPVATIPRRSD